MIHNHMTNRRTVNASTCLVKHIFRIEYDKMINVDFPEISEIRAAWSNQGASIWMRMMDKGSHWGALNGLQTLIPHAILSSILGYPFVLPDMVGGNVYDAGFNETYVPDSDLYIRWLEGSFY